MSHKTKWKTINENVLEEPTGFSVNDRDTNSEISFVDGTHTFTIQPKAPATEFYFWIKGNKYRKTSAQNLIISLTEGLHFIYFNGNGELAEQLSFTDAILKDYCYICCIYWDNTNSKAVYVAEERHGFMPWLTHKNIHLGVGTRYINGLGLGSFTVDEDGSLDSHCQFDVSSGLIIDEDISHSIDSLTFPANIPVMYRNGSGDIWRIDTARTAPVKNFSGGSGRLAYNQLTGGSWQQTEVGNNDFMLAHIIATNDIYNSIVAIQGTNAYGNINDARANATEEINSLSGLPFQEFVFIGTIIYQTSTSYTNTFKARIRSTTEGASYVDFRIARVGYSANVVDHGALTGLADDDHTQYALVDGRTGELLNPDLLGIKSIKSGATQVGAGASAGEIWKTNGHATLPDNVLLIGV